MTYPLLLLNISHKYKIQSKFEKIFLDTIHNILKILPILLKCIQFTTGKVSVY